MSDDLTPGELGRRIDRLSSDVRDDLAAITIRLDGKVRSDVLRLEQQAQDARIASQAERITALEHGRTDDAKERKTDRRWLLSVLIFPVVLIVLTTIVQVLWDVWGPP